ncbi:MAG TPA: enoyl-CoA hydratase-related protein [Capillimicrobium sp.]|jgi:crotonobetainyl-CoA hydratase
MSVRVRVDGPRATVEIDRPEVLNALDVAHREQLEGIWDELERDDRVRVVVLTGAGDRAFCVGADMRADDPEGMAYWSAARPGGFGGISLRTTMLKPVIARVNGHALGGGFEMMLACDLAIAVPDATFGLPEALVGRVPLDGGIAHLLRAVPPKTAAELLLTGRRIGAAEASRLGLVNAVVEPARLDQEVDALVERLLAAAPLSQQAIKAAARSGGDTSQPLPALIAALESEDAAEGVRAFNERRAPVWSAR